MKKEELKKVLKPLIKECIKEVIFEDGTLSGIITEVAKGLGSTQLQAAPSKPITNLPQSTSPLLLRQAILISSPMRWLEWLKRIAAEKRPP